MNARSSIIIRAGMLAAAVAATAAISGCSTVGLKEVLSTSFGEGNERAPAAPRAAVAEANANTDPLPRYFVVQTADQSLPASATTGIVNAGAVAYGSQTLTSDQLRFVFSTSNEISAMKTRFQQLGAQANVKGISAITSMKPYQRTYDHAVEQVRLELAAARLRGTDDWDGLVSHVDTWMGEAQRALDRAIIEVEGLPNPRSGLLTNS